MATTSVRKYNMEELCVSFISRNRFYSCILSKLNKIPVPPTCKEVKTAGVGFTPQGKLVLYYSEKFFGELNLAQAQAIIEHEVLHVFFQHLVRMPMSPDPKDANLNKLQNYALDMAINQYLPDLPEGAIYPKTFNLEEGQYAEWYLVELKKIKEQQEQQKQKQKQQGGQPQSNPNGMPDLTEDDGSQGSTIDSHEMWGKTVNDKGEVEDASHNENCDMEHELEKIVRQAAKECEGDKSMGDLPAGIRRELESLRNPKRKHNWKRELRVFVNSVLTVTKRLSQKKVNRRMIDHVDYYLPGKKKSKRPSILLARDTSGSVCNDEIQKQFLNEMINISKFCDVLVADCDTKVHQVYTVKRVGDFKKYIGGGGTSFEPIFAEAKKRGVDGIIYLTDTEGSFPKKEDIGKFASKTIWVTIDQKNVSVPFGKHVNITEE